MNKLCLYAAVLALGGCSTLPAQNAPTMDFNAALAPVFEGDMPSTLARLAALPERDMNARQLALRTCMQARFGGAAADRGRGPLPALTSLAGDVLASYRRYWTAALQRTSTAEAAEASLLSELEGLSGTPRLGPEARAESPARLAELLEAQGLFVLGGVTPPLREFMLWRQQTRQVTHIELPGGAIDVAVTLLDDFVSLGWAAWATCDKSHTGGWATADGIMVVRPAWDLDSESYRISLLAHEAQHFSDYRRYPQLAGPDLEYRAKLVELALAADTQRKLLDSFSTRALRDRALPHSFASYWVVERLRSRIGGERWIAAPRLAIRQAALAELAAHGTALDERGRASVTTALPD
jgi:hypothetical protein